MDIHLGWGLVPLPFFPSLPCSVLGPPLVLPEQAVTLQVTRGALGRLELQPQPAATCTRLLQRPGSSKAALRSAPEPLELAKQALADGCHYRCRKQQQEQKCQRREMHLLISAETCLGLCGYQSERAISVKASPPPEANKPRCWCCPLQSYLFHHALQGHLTVPQRHDLG